MKTHTRIGQYFTEHEYGQGDTVVFMVGGWKFKAPAYRFIVNNIVRQGFKCVLYVPHGKLIAIGTPYSEIVAASRWLSDHLEKKIALEKSQGARAFIGFGISFGTVFAMESAKQLADIKKLILIAPFGDFAEHVKLWPRSMYFGRVLASQPTGRQESGEVLNLVGSTKQVHKLKEKNVLVCYAVRDRIVHTKVTLGLLDELHKHQVQADIVKIPGGHMTGVYRSLMIDKTYLRFLTS